MMSVEECYHVIGVYQITKDRFMIRQITSSVNSAVSQLFNRTCSNDISRETMIKLPNTIVNSVIFLSATRVDFGRIKESFMRR